MPDPRNPLEGRRPILAFLLLLAILGTAVAAFGQVGEVPPTTTGETDLPADPASTDPAVPGEGETDIPEPLTDAQERDDEELRARLQGIFDRIGSLRDVTVEVEAGIVRLRGDALNLDAKQRAIDLVHGTDGVVFLEDDLQVVTSLGERLEPALERLRDYGLRALAFLPLLVVSIILLALMIAIGNRVARWDGPHLRYAKSAFSRGLARQLIRGAFILVGVLLALELLDATALVGAVLGTAGVFGLALGFAFQDIVENHLAGIMLSIRQPFAPNDHILVDGNEGKVVRLTTRETILMTHAGNHVRIPNADIFKSVVTNFTRNPRRRFDFTVSVGTGDDLVLAQTAGIEALQGMTGVMEDPGPSALTTELGDSWVTLRFFGWVDQSNADFGRVRSEAIRLVKLALEAAEISMPSPEYVVAMRGGTGALPLGSNEGGPPPAATPPAEPDDPESPVQQDVSVDSTLDEQIEEDRAASDEADLLRDGPVIIPGGTPNEGSPDRA